MGDYYQGIVYDYLKADRSIFINPECTIQIAPGDQPPKGKSWICDAVAVDFRAKTVFLCEITYSGTLQALLKRLSAWNQHWKEICDALSDKKYNNIPCEWKVKPWIFVPEELREKFKEGMDKIQQASGGQLNFEFEITTLETVQPWKYCTWNRTPRVKNLSGLGLGFKADS